MARTELTRVRREFAQLPEFFPESVIFVANLQSLFFGNEAGHEELCARIGGVETYGGRLLPVLNLLYRGGQNLLLLEARPDLVLEEYHAELGLELPEARILSHADYLEMSIDEELRAYIENHPAQVLDGFVTDDRLEALAASLGKTTLSSSGGSRRGNNKLLLHEFLVETGLPHFETRVAHEPEEIPPVLEELRRLGYERAVLKAPIGASGIGVIRVPTLSEQFSGRRDLFFHEGICLVQGWLDATFRDVHGTSSPSVQMFVRERELTFFDVTEQILSEESVHEGNQSPPLYIESKPDLREELLRQAELIGLWLQEQGYRGPCSVDFLVVKRSGGDEVIACELNARVTGATYPSALARHFTGPGSWLMRNLRFRAHLDGRELLRQLAEAGSLYLRGNTGGVLPLNFNLDEEGRVLKGQFLCLGRSRDQSTGYLDLTRDVLPVEWDYVYD